MAERETIIDTGDGGAAAVIASLLLVALILVGGFYFLGLKYSNGSKTIMIDSPKVTVSVAPNRQ